MFDYILSRIRGRRSKKNREQVKNGVQLLATMLVCFPEIETVSYEPKKGRLTMDFDIMEHISPEAVEEFSYFLADSIETYNHLENGSANAMLVESERYEDLTIIHISRKLTEMTRGEISLIAKLIENRFGDKLLVDSHTLSALEPEFALVQQDTLDRMLTLMRDTPLNERLVGIREHNQVVVYNR